MRIDDMRLFARLAETGSFTAAARELHIPKQTLSRRIAALEAELGVQLVQRTTRHVRLTEAGSSYALRCAELVRLVHDANLEVSGAARDARGTLRVTADPTFAEAFLGKLIARYAAMHPNVSTEVVVTNRHVDLIEEGFDVAFRVGRLNDAELVGRRIGPARLIYCAAPEYLQRRGAPLAPSDLKAHDCIELAPQSGPTKWPFFGTDGPLAVTIRGRLRVNSLALALTAALDGLGIVNLPQFACAAELGSGRLVEVLEPFTGDVGAIHLVYPRNRFLAARVRRFIDLAAEHFEQGAAL